MESELTHFYLKQQEPVKGCLLAMRDIILAEDADITHTLKYGMPFFCYKGKMFCYLWIDKKLYWPYIGFVEGKHLRHPDLRAEKRARMKTIMFDPNVDLPVDTITGLVNEAIDLYKNGTIIIKSK